ncbi:PEP/pyruvate-binding domain-containing protein [Chengkuizengella axinellae]|uniref:PEP/pyruvate-binding domain-containing protein n=1 Tax=Chengkuizengella axinellae TaxID=3064388 RepID=A0ABT9J1E3_9BACL|nr:PEP/pyruvate-binding domain-containing protein [Chengkuizengella sp. 2205SS18-9]MDP5275439.1 PEP/pyruvate-binding domain-containing protein [Chengkuizengella sp. 2205SS18-9]
MNLWFEEIGGEDFHLVGGKGYNLSRMYNLGLNVPNGFVISTVIYDEYLMNNKLIEKINEILNLGESSLKQSEVIKEYFKEELISNERIKQIELEVSKFASGRLAIRSSSTAEDLPGMSFAGQYNTYLNVTIKDVVKKIILCWQSLWNERAIEYRKKYKISSDFSHAVVIQEMVNAKISGIIFTANPLTGVRNEFLINSSYGLGEAIVSGEVNPDQYTVNKDDRTIIKKEISSKDILCQFSEEGIQYVPVENHKRTANSLQQQHIQMIVNEAEKIQNYFGLPQDIEFAINDKDEFFVVQSRDITSLFPIENLDQDGKLRAYLCVNTVMLGMKEPFTPLGFDMFSESLPAMINIMTSRKKPINKKFVKYTDGRIFVDISYLLSNKFIGKQFGKAFAGNDLPLEETMNKLILQHGKKLSKQGIKFRIPWGVIKYGYMGIQKLREAKKIPITERYDHLKSIGETVIQEHIKKAAKLESIEDKLDFMKIVMIEAFNLAVSKQSWYCTEYMNFPKIEKKIWKMYGDTFDITPLTKSFPGCISVELGMLLNQLAKYFDEYKIEPTKNHPKIKELLNKFGHRSTVELDFGINRWSEDPEYMISLIKSYMVDQMYYRNIAEINENGEKADLLIEEIYQKIKVDKGKRKALKMKQMMIDYRIAAGMREYPKFDIVRMMTIARGVMLDVGEEFKKDGFIEEVEDIFYLRESEIINKKKLRQVVIKNKHTYQKQLTRTTIPRIILNTGETYYSAQKFDPNSKMLQGMPLSAGTYEGKVRVVINPTDSNLLEGEVLVTESTNPAWTPLFITAKGLIMEYGGPVSHGGIVAREYGIPAVVGIPSATSVLKDGQMVRVNGETGKVEILE